MNNTTINVVLYLEKDLKVTVKMGKERVQLVSYGKVVGGFSEVKWKVITQDVDGCST